MVFSLLPTGKYLVLMIMRALIKITLIFGLLWSSGCKDELIVLPCEVGEEHPYNGGSILANVNGEDFQGKAVFNKNDDGSFKVSMSRFSLDQCYTSDLIFIPSFEWALNDTSYFDLTSGIVYQIFEGQNALVEQKKIFGNNNWMLLRTINMDTTEIRGDFRFRFVDENSAEDIAIGSVEFEEGQFFCEFRE